MIVHSKTLGPVPKPVTPELGEPGVVIVPEPLINVHVPVPTVAVFPAKFVEVAHIVWLLPALETVGIATPVIVTCEVEGVQGALEIVHSKTLGPVPKPVTPEVGEDGVVIVPEPLINVHAPVPVVGVFPAKVAEVAQTVWLAPATEVVGPPVFVMVT